MRIRCARGTGRQLRKSKPTYSPHISPDWRTRASLPRGTTAAIALATGWGVMAAEMGLVRLVTPYLGASLPIWATVIALVLLSLATGAVLGGRLSRRASHARALVTLLACAGLLLAVMPLALRWILEGAVESTGASLVFSVVALLLLAGLPLLLAGAVAPLLVQARARGLGRADPQVGEPPGAAAGLVTASSTLGSLLGTLVPAFLTLPYLGTSRTFLLAAVPLLVGALWIHWTARLPGGLGPGAAALVLLMVGGSLAPFPRVRRRPGTVATAESAHHHISVVRRPGGHLVLLLDAGYAEQSYYDPSEQLFYGPWPIMAAAPLLARSSPVKTDSSRALDSNRQPWRVLLVGLGGGTAARLLVRAFPKARVVGAELDREVLRLARKHMALNHPRIHGRVADGRLVLRQRRNTSLDVVLMDAAHHLLVPFHLVTTEMFQLARRKLRPGGVVVINMARLADDTALVDAIAFTGSRTFARVYRLDVIGGANTLLIFANHALHANTLARQSAALTPPALARYVALNLASLSKWRRPGGTPVLLTDDRAPVAPLILSMLWRHVTGGP